MNHRDVHRLEFRLVVGEHERLGFGFVFELGRWRRGREWMEFGSGDRSGCWRRRNADRRGSDRRSGVCNRRGRRGSGHGLGLHGRRGLRRDGDRRRYRGLWRRGRHGSGRGIVRLQFLARRFAGPCAGIDLADDREHLFGSLHAFEVTHVQAESFAAIFETAADEEGILREGRIFGLRQRHGRGRRRQINYKSARRGSAGGPRQLADDVVWLGTHV